jgi:hypothetical protein
VLLKHGRRVKSSLGGRCVGSNLNSGYYTALRTPVTTRHCKQHGEHGERATIKSMIPPIPEVANGG